MLKELEKLLKAVPDTYDDFVKGILLVAGDDDELLKKTLAFMKENPDADSSTIVGFASDIFMNK